MRPTFLVPARDKQDVDRKIREIQELGYDYLVVCGEPLSRQNVVFRSRQGKYDALNYGSSLSRHADVLCLNDVDTTIVDFAQFLREFEDCDADILFSRIEVRSGPQRHFQRLMDLVRSRVVVAASGEMMLVKNSVMKQLVPLPPCKAEDSYLVFKAMEKGFRVRISRGVHVITERTRTLREEIGYKRRTTLGIYQALSLTRPPVTIRIFYTLLPLFAWALVLGGATGLSWAAGIYWGLIAYLKGDRTGAF